jgi:hypothetical protein
MAETLLIQFNKTRGYNRLANRLFIELYINFNAVNIFKYTFYL